jgi:PEGA domain
MKRSTLLTPLVAIAALTLVSSTAAVAQQREHGRERSERQSEGKAVERGQPRSDQPRAAQPQPQQRQEQRRAEPAPRVEQRRPEAVAPRVEQRRPEAVAPRVEQRRPEMVAPRVEQRRPEAVAPRVEQRRPEPRGDVAVPRTYPRTYAPRNDQRYESRYAPRYSAPRYEPRYDSRWNGRYVVPRYYEPRWYQPRFYYRPYVFRPRFSIGFGIFAGYPVPYTYSYPSYAYGASYGGVSLDIAPFNGEVYVDGGYMGIVEDFDGTNQALTLRAGRHRIEVRAPGYADLVFDVDVMPGQVIPYRGDLQPY